MGIERGFASFNKSAGSQSAMNGGSTFTTIIGPRALRGLRCLVAVDLKIGAVQPAHASKLNFYLAALVERRRFASQAESKMACFNFIEGWYNPVRLHSALGYRSPMACEDMMEGVAREP